MGGGEERGEETTVSPKRSALLGVEAAGRSRLLVVSSVWVDVVEDRGPEKIES